MNDHEQVESEPLGPGEYTVEVGWSPGPFGGSRVLVEVGRTMQVELTLRN